MQYLEKISNENLFTKSEEIKEKAEKLLSKMEIALLRNQMIEIVNEDYDLGKVTDVYEIFGGYINRSFGIYTEKDGKKYEYFVRKYKKGIEEKEIMFEHSLIEYSRANGLTIAADIIHTKKDETYVKRTEGKEDRYFAVYEYLVGEDKYTWDNPIMEDEEYKSAARVMATFHNASKDFDPKGLERVEPKIMDFLPTLPQLYKEFAEKDYDNVFHNYYVNQLEEILEVIETSQISKNDVNKMPFTPIHCDFHPGNLKFINYEAVGIFDFDWSKIDLRLFDVCLGMAYCCSRWDDEHDGTMLLDKCEIFLKAYQNKLKELNDLEPLSELELSHMGTMMAAANVYLINWDVVAYYEEPTINVYEQKAYLQHNVKLMKWIENHKDEIKKMALSIK
jgi:homoserine kinase type II